MSIELRHDGILSRTIHTETEIDAPHDTVWRVLTDLEAFAQWNPVMTRVEGQVELGAVVKVGFRAGVFITVRCRVDSLQPGTRLSWIGGPPGLLRGHHYFECHPLRDGRTHLIHGETFSGVLVPPLWPSLAPQLRKNYQAMNRALALRASALSKNPGVSA